MKNYTKLLVSCFGVLLMAAVAGTVSAADPASPEKKVESAAPVAPKSVTPPSVTPAAVVPVTPAVAVPTPSLAVAPAASGPVDDNSISLDFKDAEITSVLRVLSMKSNVNIVTGPEVKGLVTVRLDNVPWDKALDVILRTYDYVFERDGNIIRVTTRDKMKQEPVETKTFILNYSKAAEIQTSIQDILTERGRVKVSERTNMVVVTDIPTNLYKIGEVIKKLDQLTPQAFIDSKIIKTEAGAIENMGIQWNPTVSAKGASRPTTFPFAQAGESSLPASIQQFFPVVSTVDGKTVPNAGDARNFPYPVPAISGNTFTYGTLDFSKFSATLNFLKAYGNTKVVSNPRIVVLNNQTAHIQVGQQIPLPTYERNETTGSMVISGFSYKDVGVVLNVTPHINSAEEILVDLKPEISSKNGEQSFGGDVQAPIFDTTQAQTQLLIRSGQTIAIGGLLTDNVSQSETKVPYLADIPLVGKLFRSKRQGTADSTTPGSDNKKTETLFFVTVTTVDSQGQPVGEKVDGTDKSQNAKADQKTAATGAEKSLKDSGMTNAVKDAKKTVA
ncbi:MAG TPA: secretin N-terminal domain-containing protein [Candidatus Omnitrophota bacterium]|nr:secretin N-terminal domain-containing protein [Candidatus Omnitrophota bacterium]